MSQFPHLPLFTDAYLGDTKHLSCEEHGAYLQLLIIAWRSPACAIPNDDARIARMIGVTAKRWAGMKATVMAFWTLTNEGWVQKRLSKERAWVEKRSAIRSDAGKQGGRPKSLKSQESEKAKGSQEKSKTKAPIPIPREDTLDTGVSNAAQSAPEITPVDAIWLKFPGVFADLSGQPEDKVRRWIGRCLRDYAPEVVLSAFETAATAGTGDPFAYVTRVLKNSTTRPPTPGRAAKTNPYLEIYRQTGTDHGEQTHDERPADHDIISPRAGADRPSAFARAFPGDERPGTDGALPEEGPARRLRSVA